jgi:tyrosyl-tRNA synthetase
LNDKLEDERLMMKAENMSSMLNVIDTIAGSANIPAKVKGEEFIEYWKAQMEKDPHMRNMFEMMTEEEMQMKFGQDGMPGTGDEGMNAQGGEGQEQQLSPEEAEAMQRQAEEEGKKAGRKQAKRIAEPAAEQVKGPDTQQEQEIKQLFQ